MAGRRTTLKAIDWLAFAERVPPNQRTMFNNLKTRSDAISAKLNTTATAYIEASKARIIQYEKELEKFRNMIPFDQMTIEDLNETFPETKLDKEKNPYWPHKPIAELLLRWNKEAFHIDLETRPPPSPQEPTQRNPPKLSDINLSVPLADGPSSRLR
eukprot:superscaffoldBa00001828_g12192